MVTSATIRNSIDPRRGKELLDATLRCRRGGPADRMTTAAPPIQIWVPDVRSHQFAEQAHGQSLAVASSQHEADDQAFIDALNEDE
jgi:hypothetical protein